MNKTIQASAVQIGDMLFSSHVAGRVQRIEEYPAFSQVCSGTARIARLDNGRDMTLIDGTTCEIAA